MSNLLECYEILGVTAGARIADVTSSYRKLCRTYHPDINSDPGSGELMTRINEAYATLRKKFAREAFWRERGEALRRSARAAAAQAGAASEREDARAADAEDEKNAFNAIHGYFAALRAYDYSGAYNYLSAYDRRRITRDSFVRWRTSVARMYPMRGFDIASGSKTARVSFGTGKTLYARRFHVIVAEGGQGGSKTGAEGVDKLVIRENGVWKVLLGHKDVGALASAFDERLEENRKKELAKRWVEYLSGLQPEYDMASVKGLRKAMAREMYRQKRFGGALTLAALAVTGRLMNEAEEEELLRGAAGTINKTLRETDVPAYAGGNVFLILFVELQKKSAENIISRLAKKIAADAGLRFSGRTDITYVFDTWTAGDQPRADAADIILDRLRKKC